MSRSPHPRVRPTTVERALADMEGLCVYICNRHRPPAGFDFDDQMQIARMAVVKAWNAYAPGGGKHFPGYVTMVVERELWKALKAADAGKRRALNEAVSYDAPAGESEGTLANTLTGPETDDPAVASMHRARFLAALQKIRLGDLTPRERRCFLAVEVDGLTQDAVALALGVSRKRVGQILKSARAKLDTDAPVLHSPGSWQLDQGWQITRRAA